MHGRTALVVLRHFDGLRLGVHRSSLARVIPTQEADLVGDRPFVVPEVLIMAKKVEYFGIKVTYLHEHRERRFIS